MLIPSYYERIAGYKINFGSNLHADFYNLYHTAALALTYLKILLIGRLLKEFFRVKKHVKITIAFDFKNYFLKCLGFSGYIKIPWQFQGFQGSRHPDFSFKN